MSRNTGNYGWLMAVALTGAATGAEIQPAPWTAAERDGRIEAMHGNSLMLAWQNTPLAKPAGGAKFAASAFLHPLRTPSGFEWTSIQPADHLHHLGLWWPWKYLEVDGAHYNCWEIQEGQGALVAKDVKQLDGGPDKLEWEFQNVLEIRKAGVAPETVIHETARVAISAQGNDANVIDISLKQRTAGKPVTIVEYRYSGFSWRGPVSWNKDNSKMTTSEGKDRENANGTPARWVMVSGPTPNGSASVLMMSAAVKNAGTPEKLRVWDSKNGNGMPFANFNPVMEKPLPLDDAHPAVSDRKYRVIAADHMIDAAEAEAAWKKWMEK